MAEPWRPLSARRGGEETIQERDALVEGAPSWLVQSLREWGQAHLGGPGDWSWVWSPDALRQVERGLRLQLDWATAATAAADVLDLIAPETADSALDLIDFLLWHSDPYYAREVGRQLEVVLLEGGSAWTVGEADGHLQLQRRVSDEAAASFDAATRSGRPGEHLRRSWASAFGREPNPSMAYREAVKAVEAALKPIVAPSDGTATLGKMIGDLRTAPQRWHVSLGAQDSFDSVGAVRSMLELLWKAQHDRHGTDNEAAPMDIDQEAAEAAVHLAVTIVLWADRGVITAI